MIRSKLTPGLRVGLRFFCLICLSVWLAACVSPGQRGGDRTSATVAQAQQLAQTGDHLGAGEVYLTLAQRAPGPDRNLLLQDAAAEFYLGGDRERARDTLARVSADARITDSDNLVLRMLAADLALDRGDAIAALALERPTLARRSLLIRFHDLRARAFAANRSYLEAARERMLAASQMPASSARDAQYRALFEDLSNVSTLTLERKADELSENDPLRGWLDLALVDRAGARAGDSTAALARWRELYPSNPAAGGLDQHLLKVSAPPIVNRALRIALMLPLEGRFSDVAQAVRDGFLAAHLSADAAPASIDIVNLGDESESAAATYHRLKVMGYDWIVGPLRRESVNDLLTAVVEFPVPLLALNYADGGAAAKNVWQTGLLPEHDARATALKALADGRERALILVPDNTFGERLRWSFADAFRAQGGEVVAVQTYPPGQGDFSGTVARLLRVAGLRNPPAQQEGDENGGALRQPSFTTGADMLFIAAMPREGRIIKPQLRFAGAGWLPVYATSHIYGASPSPSADSDINGVTFCDAPWILGESVGPFTRRELANQFEAAGGPSARLFALGADAYRLLPYLNDVSGRWQRSFPGMTGLLQVDQHGRLLRELSCARFRGGVPRMAFDENRADPNAALPDSAAQADSR